MARLLSRVRRLSCGAFDDPTPPQKMIPASGTFTSTRSTFKYTAQLRPAESVDHTSGIGGGGGGGGRTGSRAASQGGGGGAGSPGGRSDAGSVRLSGNTMGSLSNHPNEQVRRAAMRVQQMMERSS